MNNAKGKGAFSYLVPAICRGDPAKTAKLCKQMGLERVDIRCADGPFVDTMPVWLIRGVLKAPYASWGEHLRQDLVDALHAEGILVYGYGAPYGIDPSGEGHVAVAQINRFGLDGYILDVEAKYDTNPGRVASAYTLRNIIKKGTNVPIGFCWWSRWRSQTGVQWHPPEVAKAFMSWCDFGMPMQYWAGSSIASVDREVRESLKQWRELTDKPLVAAGRAYTGDGGTLNPDAIVHFGELAKELGFIGTSLWALYYTWDNLFATEAIASMPQYFSCTGPIQPEPDLAAAFLRRPEQERWCVVADDLAERGILPE